MHCIAIAVPLWLLMAHLDHGSDTASTTAIYSAGFGVLALLSITLFGFRRLPNTTSLIAVIFLFWLSMGWFGPWSQARAEVQALASAGAIALTGYVIGWRARPLTTAWISLIITLLCFSALAFYFHFTAVSEPTNARDVVFDSRLSGEFGSPNTAATLFAMSIILAISHVFVRVQDTQMNRLTTSNKIHWLTQKEILSFLLVLVALTCLILTRSRAGILIGFLLALFLIALELHRSVRHGRFKFLKRRAVSTGLTIIALALIVIAIFGGLNPQHVTAIGSDLQGRLGLFDVYWDIWLTEPYLGHGLGSFNRLNDEFTTLENASGMVRNGAAHNVILQWLIQQGAIGLALMSGILIACLVPIIRALNVRASVPRHFLRAVLVISAIVFLHGMGDYAMEIPSVMWTYAFVLGLGSGFAKYVIDSAQPKHE
jgi:O-antigen ligase